MLSVLIIYQEDVLSSILHMRQTEDIQDHLMDRGWHLHEGQDPGSCLVVLLLGKGVMGICYKCHIVSDLAITM